MLKYLNTQVTFAEVPDEITLCINITGCKNGCKNCHSSYLAEDIGKPLDEDSLVELMLDNKGITCVAFMGGDSEPAYINWLADIMRSMNDTPGSWADVKIAWYSGRKEIPQDICLKNFDYIKLGPYIEECGPLDNPNTNQKMYKVNKTYEETGLYVLEDITRLFWKEQP